MYDNTSHICEVQTAAQAARQAKLLAQQKAKANKPKVANVTKVNITANLTKAKVNITHVNATHPILIIPHVNISMSNKTNITQKANITFNISYVHINNTNITSHLNKTVHANKSIKAVNKTNMLNQVNISIINNINLQYEHQLSKNEQMQYLLVWFLE